MNRLFYKLTIFSAILGGVAPLSFALSEYDQLLLKELSDGAKKPILKAEPVAQKKSEVVVKKQESTPEVPKAVSAISLTNIPATDAKKDYRLSVMLVECLSMEEAKPLRLPQKVQDELNQDAQEGALLEEHTACAPLLAHVVRKSSIDLNLNKPEHNDARRAVAFKYQRPIVKQKDTGSYYLETTYEDAAQTLGTFMSAWLKNGTESKLRLNFYAHAFTTDGNLEEVVYHNLDKVFVHTRPQVLERVLLVSEFIELNKEYILSGDVYMRRQAPENLKKLMPEKGRLWAVIKLINL